MSQAFHSKLRAHVTVFLLTLILTIFSMRLITRLRRTPPTTSSTKNEEEDDDNLDSLIPRFVLSLSLSISLANILTIPLSCLASVYLPTTTLPFPLHWIDPLLFLTIRQDTLFLSRIALFVLLPMAYFFSETFYPEHISTGIWLRLRDATWMWMLVASLVHAGWWALTTLLGFDSHQVFSMSSEYLMFEGEKIVFTPQMSLPDAYVTMTVAVGSLHLVPKGLWGMWRWIRKLPLPIGHSRKVQEHVLQLELENNSWNRRLMDLLGRKPSLRVGFVSDEEAHNERHKYLFRGSRGRSLSHSMKLESATETEDDTFDRANLLIKKRNSSTLNTEEIRKRIEELSKETQRLNKQLRHSPFQRNILFVFLVCFSTFSWFLLLLTMVSTFLTSLLPLNTLLLGVVVPADEEPSWFVQILSSLAATLFPFFPTFEELRGYWTLPQVVLAAHRVAISNCLLWCCAVGVYDSPLLKKRLRLKQHCNGMRRVVLNIIMWTIVGYGLPFLCELVLYPEQEAVDFGWFIRMLWRMAIIIAVGSLGWVEWGLWRATFLSVK